jgi:mono/diheme cytochrome c family protein
MFCATMASADGGRLYQANCASCHGRSGKGDGPSSKALKPKPKDLTSSRMSLQGIMTIVRNGRGACPSWKSSMSDSEIKSVSQYAKGLQK